MGGGKGGGGGQPAPPKETPRYSQQAAEANASAVRALQEQMARQQQEFQAALERQRQQMERAKQEAEERAAQTRRASAYESIDTLITSRLEAEETAISSVDEELKKEQSEADLRGIDYAVTDEQRKERIQKRFEEYWDVRYEKELSDLISKYGDPEMTAERRLAVERGDEVGFWNPDIKHSGYEYVAPKLEEREPYLPDTTGEGTIVRPQTPTTTPVRRREPEGEVGQEVRQPMREWRVGDVSKLFTDTRDLVWSGTPGRGVFSGDSTVKLGA